ncbi:MAG: hypothetical protein HYY44_07620 [Deltaproteobacteria bacterium]|nr:hypothetical protein [Deltaproteobacteria bacterium]
MMIARVAGGLARVGREIAREVGRNAVTTPGDGRKMAIQLGRVINGGGPREAPGYLPRLAYIGETRIGELRREVFGVVGRANNELAGKLLTLPPSIPGRFQPGKLDRFVLGLLRREGLLTDAGIAVRRRRALLRSLPPDEGRLRARLGELAAEMEGLLHERGALLTNIRREMGSPTKSQRPRQPKGIMRIV